MLGRLSKPGTTLSGVTFVLLVDRLDLHQGENPEDQALVAAEPAQGNSRGGAVALVERDQPLRRESGR